MKKALLLSAGTLALVLGAIGIVLPILPTTPLVLLAGLCYSAGAERAYQWLQKSRIFGAYLRNYRENTGLPRKVKIKSVVSLWVMLILSMALLRALWSVVLLSVIGVGVSVFICSRKTAQE